MHHKIIPPFYPIIYVRGYARTNSEREEVFNDTYYGFAATSVERRQGAPDKIKNTYLQADVFEGQMIRFMKLKGYGYADAMNRGLEDFHDNPVRSIWISRFYDQDFINGRMRTIEEHAEELLRLIVETIPKRLLQNGISEKSIENDYKVILIAHSMGGLVCRTLIQQLLFSSQSGTPYIPKERMTAKNLIHRLVTIGSPHRGINLGNIPDWIEDELVSLISPDSKIFREKRMREYLNLDDDKFDIHSLGASDFPVKRCFCLIGSDHRSYISARHLTGSFSDGLVRQDNAYIVSGERPSDGKYPNDKVCYYANVHRAHSGYRGIVNSYESFENIQRFLFGNIKAELSLQGIGIHTVPPDGEVETFYDFNFRFSIRGTSVYLHNREQDPCENAIRLYKEELVHNNELYLHTAFLNSTLKKDQDNKSHFALAFKIVEYHVKKGFLWDREYPGRTIYSETAEIRIKDITGDDDADVVEYRWLSDVRNWESDEDWVKVAFTDGSFQIPLREAKTVTARLVLKPSAWPSAETEDQI
jgi:pimeloyl-ACP methyl ester carboxylesterase